MNEEPTFRFSYRLLLKEAAKEGAAIQRTVRLNEGEPVTLEQVEESLKDAIQRLIDDMRDEIQ